MIGLLLVSSVAMTACESNPNTNKREAIVSMLLEGASQYEFSQVENLLEEWAKMFSIKCWTMYWKDGIYTDIPRGEIAS
ncbi:MULTISPECIES: hypothetical protein [unclassified Paenibacillus]|uniref:hypothetical protein n=1 Tax=unclassified Paenibacillus TaxID=185978 RepID=UPI00164331FC|nr:MULTISPECIES: hypothetical protein [Paenibacillaceae]